MNKKFLIVVGIFALVVTVLATVTVSKAAIFYYGSDRNIDVASTTAQFVLANGTVTKTFGSDGFEGASLLVAIASSSTAPTLCWSNQFSDNGTDWYSEDSIYASSTVHVATQRSDCFIYSTSTGTTLISTGSDGKTVYVGKKIDVNNFNTVMSRTIFTVTGANARLDVRVNKKNEIVISK